MKKKMPDLRVIEIFKENGAGITPGVYVSVEDLIEWLNRRNLKLAASVLYEQAVEGTSLEVKYAQVFRT